MLVWHQQSSAARVELSAASTWNYVCKAANLLFDEYQVGPGSTVCVRLPVHWQSIGWVLATWALGARVSQQTADGADACVMTARQAATESTAHTIVASLDMWGGPCTNVLPAGVLDAGRDLRMQPDATMWPQVPREVSNAAAALPTGSLTFLSLADAAEEFSGQPISVGMHRPSASGNPPDGNATSAAHESADVSAPIVSGARLAAVAAVCGAGCIVIADGDSSWASAIAQAESVSSWL